VGEYEVTVGDGVARVALPGTARVSLGEVTEVEARTALHVAGSTNTLATGAGMGLTGEAISELPVNSGEWRSLALTIPGANGAASVDQDAGEANFRGVAVTQNSTRTDGANGDKSFGGGRVGSGVAEDEDAGSDVALDPASGVGSGSGSVHFRRQVYESSVCRDRAMRRLMVLHCLDTALAAW
jgi:hypothetical protein